MRELHSAEHLQIVDNEGAGRALFSMFAAGASLGGLVGLLTGVAATLAFSIWMAS